MERAHLGHLVRNQYITHQLFWPLVTLGLLLVVCVSVQPGFLRVTWVNGHLQGNLIDVLNRAAPLMLVSIGMTLVIAIRGLDISVGAVVAISAAVAALLIGDAVDGGAGQGNGFVLGVAIAGALLTAMLCGLWNGLL